jgi:hypothetical protein
MPPHPDPLPRVEREKKEDPLPRVEREKKGSLQRVEGGKECALPRWPREKNGITSGVSIVLSDHGDHIDDL